MIAVELGTRRRYCLPFGAEIGSGLGLRTNGQGYNAIDNNRQKFALTERDSITGLDHTWFRKYESLAGRWTSPDPLVGSIANPQSFNRYTYVNNDPVNFIDPTGLDEKWCKDILTGEWFPCPDTDIERVEIWEPNWYDLPFLRDYPAIALFFPSPREGPSSGPIVQLPTRRPQDPDTRAINTALGACSTGASIGQYSTVNPSGTAWRGGLNGKSYPMGWGGNQYTGARSATVARSTSFGLLSRATGTLGAGFSFYQSSNAFRQGNYDQGARGVWDAGLGLAGAFGGPVGAAASGTWFGLSTLADSNPDLARACKCDAQCRRK